jgi:hypothetical protein
LCYFKRKNKPKSEIRDSITVSDKTHVDDVSVTTVNTAVYPSTTYSSYTPVQTLSPFTSALTELSGLGTDYCVYYSDHDATIWRSSWIQDDLRYWKNKGLSCTRLGFEFSDITSSQSTKMSTYNAQKMHKVIDILEAKGHTVILLLQNSPYGTMQHYCGSQNFVNNWLQVARDFKGDQRVKAFSLFGEPNHDINGYDTWDTSIISPLQFYQKMMDLTKAIHAIDPNRVVILPFAMGYYTWERADLWINDLVSVGFREEPNTMVDVDHPYFFENDWDGGRTPAQVAEWHGTNMIKPFVEAFGADRCYLGETFAWVGNTTPTAITPSNPSTSSLQLEWLTAIMNVCVQYQVPFNIWASLVPSAEREVLTKMAVEASNWQS